MKNIIFLLSVVLLFTNCEDVIDLDVPTTTPKLVIEASIYYSEEETIENYIKLALTSNFYEEEQELVSNAEVKIMDQTNNLEYNFVYNDSAYFNPSFVPEFNTNYSLQVTYNNEVYQSITERLIPTEPLSPLVQGDGYLFSEDEVEIVIEYQDDSSIDNYYFLELDYDNYLTSDDEFYQGNLFSFSYYYEDLNVGDELTVELQGINQRYYNYLNILLEQSQDSGNPFGTTPSTVIGNVVNTTKADNFPVGYFRLSEISKQSIVIE